MIAVLNDNSSRLRSWSARLGPGVVKTYSHPGYFLADLKDDEGLRDQVTLVLADKFYNGKNLLNSEAMKELKKELGTRVSFVVTSSAHQSGDVLPGYVAVLDGRPRSFADLQTDLKTFGLCL